MKDMDRFNEAVEEVMELHPEATAVSFSRGHGVYYYRGKWKYADNNQPIDEMRPCKRCGRIPTPEGYDACIGYIEGAWSACCGHGIVEPFVKYEEN